MLNRKRAKRTWDTPVETTSSFLSLLALGYKHLELKSLLELEQDPDSPILDLKCLTNYKFCDKKL